MRRVVVIGGGVAGLATALHLKDRASSVAGGLDIVVLEASTRVGGNISTERTDGFTIERGPNGFLDNVAATRALVGRLGLEAQQERADSNAAKRFLFRGGRLRPLPSGPLSFLRSSVLSRRGRLRVLMEPVARPPPVGVDESIYEFARRRIGREAADILIDAMVSGIFAGDSQALSLASSLPKMARMEREHGSLVRAMLARRRRSKGSAKSGGPSGPGGTLTSFSQGLDVLTSRLASELDGIVHCSQPCTAIELENDGRYTVRTANDVSIDADAVLVATPAGPASLLLSPLDERLGAAVEAIPSAGLAVVALGFKAADVGGPPAGFGFLVPRCEGLRMLGCLWDSSIFASRAPKGFVLLRVMIGGAHDPSAVELDDTSLLAIARAELETTMNNRAAPILTRVFRHRLGIAQYVRGHREKLDRIESQLTHLPGLWVAGSSFYGVSINACVEGAAVSGDKILRWLR